MTRRGVATPSGMGCPLSAGTSGQRCGVQRTDVGDEEPGGVKQRAGRPATASMRHTRSLDRYPVPVLALLFVLAGSASASLQSEGLPDLSTIPTPPLFVHRANAERLYFVVDTISASAGKEDQSKSFMLREREFRCRARAYPNVTYEWFKDDEPFDLDAHSDRVTRVPGEGTFFFGKLQRSDVGRYRCKASNGNGTAIDREVDFRLTWIGRFPEQEPKIHDVQLGDPFQYQCTPPASDPEPRVWWIFKAGSAGTSFDSLNTSHISYSHDGRVFFHYVKRDDFQPNKYYTCTVENAELNEYKFGEQFQLNIKTDIRKSLTFVASKPLFISNDEEVALRGKSFTLYCFFSGYPEPSPKWYFNGAPIRYNTGRYEAMHFGKALQIQNVTDADVGQYDCRFDTMKQLNREFTLNVESAPYFPVSVGPPASVNSSEGNNEQFVCAAIGKPQPSFKFFKNGVEIVGDDARYEIRMNTLHIHDIRKGDEAAGVDGDNAVYQCEATNTHGRVWVNFYLNVLTFRPILLESDTDVDAVVSAAVDLKCKFFGSPQPQVTWSGANLAKEVMRISQPDSTGVSVLHLANLTHGSAGAYACTGVNAHGTDEGTVTLRVLEATRILNFLQGDQTVVAGQEVRLPCDIVNDPQLRVKVTWIVDDEAIPESKYRSGHYRLEANNALVITEPRKYDTGKYKCLAETKLDNKTRELQLTVKDVPDPPHVVYLHCDSANRVTSVSFSYNERMDVAAPVTEFWVQYQMDPGNERSPWQTHSTPALAKDATMSRDNRGGLRTYSSAVSVELDPYGEYQFRVLARNSVGDSAPKFAVENCTTAAVIPDRNPDAVRAGGNAPDNLIVYWRPMPRQHWNGPNFHYVVRYRQQPTEEDVDTGTVPAWNEHEVMDPYADHATIDEQPTYAPYEVQVAAVNSLGRADVEPITQIGFSGEGVPTVAPDNFQYLGALSGKSASFAWDTVPPADVNGQFKGYKVVHWHVDDERVSPQSDSAQRRYRRAAPPVKKEAVFGADSNRGVVYDLKPNKKNYAYVVVYNGAHDGPPSNVVDFDMPEGSPDSVRSLRATALSDKEVGLVWQAPAQLNGVLRSYTITWCELHEHADSSSADRVRVHAESERCGSASVPWDRTYRRVKELNAHTWYRFTVRATTGAEQPGDPITHDARTLPTGVPAVGSRGSSTTRPYPSPSTDPDITDWRLTTRW